jgi:alcohol dehydrogenase (NADP+)
MPAFGLGTWKSAPGEVQTAVAHAIRAGYRHIDCARAYGNEKEVGAGIAECIAEGIVKREDLWVTSKLWVFYYEPDRVEECLDATLADLGLDYLDLWLTHWPFAIGGSTFPPSPENALGYSPERFLKVWRRVEAMHDSGKVRSIGVSNMTVSKLEALLPEARIAPVINQVELHPFLAQPDLKAYCDAHGITLTAYSPLGSPDRPDRLKSDDDIVPMADKTVKRVAEAHATTPAAVLIRWAVQRGTTVIPKSTNPGRIEANLKALELELSDEDMAALNGLDKGARLIRGAVFMTPEMKSWEDVWA